MNRSLLPTNNFSQPISSRITQIQVSSIKEMMILAEQERRKGADIISLGVGIPHYKMPAYIRKAITEILNTKPDIDKYTLFTGIPKLKQLIAVQAEKKVGIAATEENILVTPGSMAALLYTCLTLLNPGDEVLIMSPFFASYREQVALAGGKLVEVPLIEPKDKNDLYHLDLEKFKKLLNSKTKAVIINSPQNPTGAVFLEKELKELAKIIENTQVYVITDEVYDYLIYDNVSYFNIASIKNLWPRVVRCCSFSKKYGMTGWRVGYVHADAGLLKHIMKVHDSTIVCTPHISQEAVYAAISTESPENEINIKLLEENRDLICQRLDNLPDLFTYVKPKGAYYIFPKFSLKMSSIEFALKLFHEAHVVTIPGIGFGMAGEGSIRMSYGATKDEINEAFDRIEKWWKK